MDIQKLPEEAISISDPHPLDHQPNRKGRKSILLTERPNLSLINQIYFHQNGLLNSIFIFFVIFPLISNSSKN